MIATSAMSGTLLSVVRAVGQQRRRHQLQHRVLGAGDAPPRPTAGRRPRTTMRSIGAPVCSPADGSRARHPVTGRRAGDPGVARQPSAMTCLAARDDLVMGSRGDGAGRRRSSSAEGPFRAYERTRRAGDRRRASRRPSSTASSMPWFGWLFLPLARTLGCGAPPGRERTAAAVVGAARPARPRARSSCSGCSARRRWSSATSTRCSPRRSPSPPTSSGRASEAQGVGRHRGAARASCSRCPSRSSPTASGGADARRRPPSARAARVRARRARPDVRRRSRPPRRSGGRSASPSTLLVAIVAAEEMPRNSRAYAISVLAMATGLGAGFACGPAARRPRPAGRGASSTSCRLLFLVIAVDLAAACPRPAASRWPHADVTDAVHAARFALRRGVGAFLANVLRRAGIVLPEPVPQRRAGLLSASPSRCSRCAPPRPAASAHRRRAARRHRAGGGASASSPSSAPRSSPWPCSSSAGAADVDRRRSRGHRRRCAYSRRSACTRTELFPTGRRGGANGLITAASLRRRQRRAARRRRAARPAAGLRPVMAILAVGPLARRAARGRRLSRDRPPRARGAQPRGPAVADVGDGRVSAGCAARRPRLRRSRRRRPSGRGPCPRSTRGSPARGSSPSPPSARRACRTDPGCRARTGTARRAREVLDAQLAGCPGGCSG